MTVEDKTETPVTFEKSSGNVFRGLTQTESARVFGTSLAHVSERYNGKVAQMTYDRLLGWLNALRNDVQITVVTLSEDDERKRGRVQVCA